jgi:hypothetical protein
MWDFSLSLFFGLTCHPAFEAAIGPTLTPLSD